MSVEKKMFHGKVYTNGIAKTQKIESEYLLGSGGEAQVYYLKRTDQAIKVLRKVDAHHLLVFLRSIQVTATLYKLGAAVVPIESVYVSKAKDEIGYIMDKAPYTLRHLNRSWCEVRTLKQHYQTLDNYRYTLAISLCEAVKSFHDVGFCHNDIKLGNTVLYPITATVKLIDLSYSVRNDAGIGSFGTIMFSSADYETDAPPQMTECYTLGISLFLMFGIPELNPTKKCESLTYENVNEITAIFQENIKRLDEYPMITGSAQNMRLRHVIRELCNPDWTQRKDCAWAIRYLKNEEEASGVTYVSDKPLIMHQQDLFDILYSRMDKRFRKREDAQDIASTFSKICVKLRKDSGVAITAENMIEFGENMQFVFDEPKIDTVSAPKKRKRNV